MYFHPQLALKDFRCVFGEKRCEPVFRRFVHDPFNAVVACVADIAFIRSGDEVFVRWGTGEGI